MNRQFITKTEIDRLLDAGGSDLEVDDRTTVTDLAREYAMQRGVTIRSAHAERHATPTPQTPSSVEGEDRTRAAVRSAVVAKLGEVPPDLDQTIDRILAKGS